MDQSLSNMTYENRLHVDLCPVHIQIHIVALIHTDPHLGTPSSFLWFILLKPIIYNKLLYDFIDILVGVQKMLYKMAFLDIHTLICQAGDPHFVTYFHKI